MPSDSTSPESLAPTSVADPHDPVELAQKVVGGLPLKKAEMLGLISGLLAHIQKLSVSTVASTIDAADEQTRVAVINALATFAFEHLDASHDDVTAWVEATNDAYADGAMSSLAESFSHKKHPMISVPWPDTDWTGVDPHTGVAPLTVGLSVAPLTVGPCAAALTTEPVPVLAKSPIDVAKLGENTFFLPPAANRHYTRLELLGLALEIHRKVGGQ